MVFLLYGSSRSSLALGIRLSPFVASRVCVISKKVSYNKSGFRNLSFTSSPSRRSPSSFSVSCCSSPIIQSDAEPATTDVLSEVHTNRIQWNSGVGVNDLSSLHYPPSNWSFSDRSLLAFTAFLVSVALTSLVVAAMPTLSAIRRAAMSFEKLADTAREELPTTMNALRLSTMEISDLTLELSDFSHDVVNGVRKSGKAVRTVESHIKKLGAVVQQRTSSMMSEGEKLPHIIAKKASGSVNQLSNFVTSVFSVKKSD